MTRPYYSTSAAKELRDLALHQERERRVDRFADRLGGPEVWYAMEAYAQEHWSEERLASFNTLMDTKDPARAFPAVEELRQEFIAHTFRDERGGD